MEKVVGIFIALTTELRIQYAFTVCWINNVDCADHFEYRASHTALILSRQKALGEATHFFCYVCSEAR